MTTVIERPSGCWDGCCYPRNQQDFADLSVPETLDVLKYNQVGLTTVLVLHAVAHFLWELATYVPGFTLYDGSAAVNANTHAAWWLAIDFVVAWAGIMSPWFTLHYTREGVVEKGLPRTHEYLMAYVVLSVLGGVTLLVHWALTWGELTTCDSTLCAQYKWCFVGVLVFLIVDAFLLFWSTTRALTYYYNLKRALLAGKLDLSFNNASDSYVPVPSAPGADYDSPPDPSTAPKDGTAPQTVLNKLTPLLQARLNNNAKRIQHTPPRAQAMKK